MKKVAILFTLMLAFVAATFAQNPADTKPLQSAPSADKMDKMAKHHGGGLKKQLGLTDEQNAKVQNVNATYKGKLKAIKTDASLSKDQKRAAMLEVGKSHDTEMQSVLTADQYSKFSTMKHDKMAQAKERRGNRKGGTRPDNGEKPDEKN